MNPQNIEILKKIFNWHSISEISENEILKCAEILNFPLEKEFLLKCTWSYYKKWTIFSLNREPLLFIKYVREKFIFEILGLHLTRSFFDPQLCFKNYLTGLYKKKKTAIPYIITTFEKGDNVGKHKISKYKFILGRQCYLHEILSLYDVYDRHFIIREDNSLCRIDFGRCFENLHKTYLGFKDYLKHKYIDFYDEEFQKGYNHERELIKRNLKKKKRNLIIVIRSIKTLKIDHDLIDFNVKKFVNRLIDHWSKIGFLKDAGITQCEWI